MDISCLTEAVLGRLFIELEASGRHVHVTREQAVTLFGHPLTPERPLSQPRSPGLPGRPHSQRPAAAL